MYWYVIYAVRSRSRARMDGVHVEQPGGGRWMEYPSPAPGGDPEALPVRCFAALLTDVEWTEVCAELSLDLESACQDSGCSSVCEIGPLPVIALDLPSAPVLSAAAAQLEFGLCVAPLPESDGERERCRGLYDAAAFSVGGEEMELRCPDCAGPELSWLGPDPEQQMVCGNCGARFPRQSAFLRLGDCEAILAAQRVPRLAAICAEDHSP